MERLEAGLNCLSAECSIESQRWLPQGNWYTVQVSIAFRLNARLKDETLVYIVERAMYRVSIAFRLNARLKAGKVKDGVLKASAFMSQLPFG